MGLFWFGFPSNPRAPRVVEASESACPMIQEGTNAAGRPVPTVSTNCVQCHLKAGGELTDAVHTYAQSVHDANGLSCQDCHGGNNDDDAKAHEIAFGFIGTKLSAHVKACESCHEEQGAALAKGPHHWNHQERLNIEYPLCVDCHGNHDIGNPPAEFSLSLVCADCHKDYAKKFPEYASITDTNDALWESLRKWRESRPGDPSLPDDLATELADLRAKTAALAHGAGKIEPDEAARLNKAVNDFRKKLGGPARPPGQD